MLVLSILATLVAVTAGARQPFTAFNAAHLSYAPSLAQEPKRIQRAPDLSIFFGPKPVEQPGRTQKGIQLQPSRAAVQGNNIQPIQQKSRPVVQPNNFQQIQQPSRPVVQQNNFQPIQQPSSSIVQFRRTQPNNNIQPSQQTTRGQFQYEGPFNTFGASPTFFRASGNIVEQTRAQAESTKALLKSLASNSRAVQYIDLVIRDNKCLDSLDDAIDAIEKAAKIVENNGPEIQSLFRIVDKLENDIDQDLTTVVKTSADILRQMAVLVPSFATEPAKLCNASPEETIASFSSLAKIIEDVSNSNDLQISLNVRQQLKKSSKIVSDVTTFLGKVNKSLSSFGQFCGQGKKYQNEFLVAVVGVLDDLAVLFEEFGDSEKAIRIRKNGSFLKKLVASFENLDIDLQLECGSFTSLATVLDELAEVIDSVGIDLLSEQLGVNLELGQRQTFQTRVQSSAGQIIRQYQGPYNTFGSTPNFFKRSGNIIEQTRAQADSTKSLLKSLGENRKAVKYIEIVIASNKCLGNLDDAINAIENAARIVEKNDQEIIGLFDVVEKLETETELTKVVTTSAEILRQLAVLIPSLEKEQSNLCNASPQDTIESFSSLANIIEDVSDADDLQISSSIRNQLKKSSKIVSDVTIFLEKLNNSLSSFRQFCGQGKQYQNEFLVTVVGVLEDLAVLFEKFGDEEKANGVRRNGAFLKKLVASFDNLDVDLQLDCGSFTSLATVLDELAVVIDNVGIKKLSEQLGVDLGLNQNKPIQLRGQNVPQYLGPFNTFGSTSAFFRASGNVVEQTREQAERTKALLRSLGNNRRAAQYIDAVIGSNKCLDNLDDAIDAVENTAKLVEKNGQEIINLFEIVENLEEEKDLTTVVKISAEVLRQLSVLVPNLANEPSKVCNASPEDTIESFSGLAKIIEDVSNANDILIPPSVRRDLKKSSKIISDVTTFLRKLNSSLSSYSQFCGQGKQYQNELLVAIVSVLDDLAVLLEGFGDVEKAKGVRKNSAFITKLVATFDVLDVDSDVDCGSFAAIASVLDELAELIDNVGLKKLSDQLGLDLEFL